MRAYGYVRVSGAGQVRDGHGLDVQRERIRAWAAYEGAELVAIEADEGISGAATDNRPGLRRVLRAALSACEGATLVVYKLDRLGRTAVDVQEMLGVLLEAKVRVVSLADGVDSGSGMGGAVLKLLTSILATFAELERETIRTRLLEGRKRASATNRVYAVEPAYGRRVADKDAGTLEVDEQEIRSIERIRTLRAEGFSYRAICAQLEADGVRPRRAAHWLPCVVHRLATGRRATPKKPSKRFARARAELLDAAD